jgi:hypothetical protein
VQTCPRAVSGFLSVATETKSSSIISSRNRHHRNRHLLRFSRYGLRTPTARACTFAELRSCPTSCVPTPMERNCRLAVQPSTETALAGITFGRPTERTVMFLRPTLPHRARRSLFQLPRLRHRRRSFNRHPRKQTQLQGAIHRDWAVARSRVRPGSLGLLMLAATRDEMEPTFDRTTVAIAEFPEVQQLPASASPCRARPARRSCHVAVV